VGDYLTADDYPFGGGGDYQGGQQQAFEGKSEN
jgi:hypothetical protein